MIAITSIAPLQRLMGGLMIQNSNGHSKSQIRIMPMRHMAPTIAMMMQFTGTDEKISAGTVGYLRFL